MVDRHRDPCTTAVLHRFGDTISREARKPEDEHYLFICVAIKGLEAWYLAAPSAINSLFSKAGYEAPEETATLDPKQRLKTLWKKQFGKSSALNKISSAQMMAPKFDADEARNRSASLDYFWTRMNGASKSSSGP